MLALVRADAFGAAKAVCPVAFKNIAAHVKAGKIAKAREVLLAEAKRAKVPVFLRRTAQGEIPVLLVNSSTYPKLKAFLDASVGTQIQLQPDYNNDHGSLRVGGYIIDVDTPGSRGYGEIHDTGLSWRPVKSYLPRRDGDSYVILEVAYGVTPDELGAADYYQRVRRAAIMRVPFTFDNADNDMDSPEMLQNAGEHCFTFCKAGDLDNEIYGIERKLRAAGVADPRKLMANAKVKAFLNGAFKKIMEANELDSRTFNVKLANRPAAITGLKTALPAGAKGKAAAVANWLIALDATLRYKDLMRTLDVSSDLAVRDMDNRRATAILVYDDPDKNEDFDGATYQARGKFYNWNNNGQRPAK